jgi:hypothetical protein
MFAVSNTVAKTHLNNGGRLERHNGRSVATRVAGDSKITSSKAQEKGNTPVGVVEVAVAARRMRVVEEFIESGGRASNWSVDRHHTPSCHVAPDVLDVHSILASMDSVLPHSDFSSITPFRTLATVTALFESADLTSTTSSISFLRFLSTGSPISSRELLCDWQILQHSNSLHTD